MPTPPMPNVAGMTDTLDFVKNLWGSMNVPGAGMAGMGGPSLSTDELDKKIADLKAVENWLNLNVNMLRATIQAMEVQRGTIATLKSMSESMAQAMGQGVAGATPGTPPATPFQFFAQQGAAPGTAQPAQGTPGETPAPEAAAGAGAVPAAMAWWNLLQEQFQQAVASTMSPEAMAQAAALSKDAAARFVAPGTDAGAGKPGAQENAEPGASGKARPSRPKADKA